MNKNVKKKKETEIKVVEKVKKIKIIKKKIKKNITNGIAFVNATFKASSEASKPSDSIRRCYF